MSDARTDARPTVSVVVPVRDDAGPLAHCLAAVAAQTRRPTEVVVVDNGSRDGSGRVAADAGAIVVTEEEEGIAAAASRGYDAARGDLVLRLDSDSVPPADWVQRVVDAFEHDPGLDALSGPGAFTGLPRPLRRLAEWSYFGIYFRLIGRLIGTAPLFGSNLAMRRTAWESVREGVHRHDTGIHDDLDLTIHLAPHHRLRVDPSLTMPVSARPLAHPVGMAVRARRAARTLRLHPRVRVTGPGSATVSAQDG